MRFAASSVRSSSSSIQAGLIACAILFPLTLTISCGSGGSSSSGPKFSGNTSVTVLLSSTANDELSAFGLVLQDVSLVARAGNTANLLHEPQGAEFMTINGGAVPLVNVSIPQGIYTGATVTVGSAEFTCITVDSSGSLDYSTFAYGQTPTANVTVTIPASITVTGSNMGILLDLLVAESASLSNCSGSASYSITPTFSVTPVAFSAQPTNATNGKVLGLEGAVAAIATTGDSFTLSPPVIPLTCPCSPSSPLTVSANSSTAYQGIGDFSGIGVGSLLDIDGDVQPDGSLLATRIAAYDPIALNVMTGPLLFLDGSQPTFYSMGRQQQGQTYASQPQSLGVYSYSGSTSFQVSGQFGNVANLPFAASFNASSMVAGQNISVFSQQITDYSGGQYTAATTMTLMPQTINGIVVGSSSNANFTDYTVSLAPFDLFPTLATQPGQATVLTIPSFVNVYVDNNTQMLNSQPIAPNGTFRFYGLVFNDNGTLRMDCAQVFDGVPLSAASNGTGSMQAAQVQITRRESPHGSKPVNIAVKRAY
jgi:Domain of unknown function (DUF5666)